MPSDPDPMSDLTPISRMVADPPLSVLVGEWAAHGREDVPACVMLGMRAAAEIRKINRDVIAPAERSPILLATVLYPPWIGVELRFAPSLREEPWLAEIVGADGFRVRLTVEPAIK